MINQPMDLGTVMAKLERGCYPSLDALRADIELIWQNAEDYNGSTSPIMAHVIRLRRTTQELFDGLA